MATETEIPESVYLKKGEREDNVLSENLEEKVTELGNKVMHLESGSRPLESGSQPLETSSQVAETVNLETGKATNESETFIQALSSVPMVTSDAPESCEATTTEDQEESKTTKVEDFKEGTPNVDEQVKAVSTLTEPEEEAIETEDKYDQKAIEKKASEGIGPDKAEPESGLKLSDSMASSNKEVPNMLEKDQGHSDDIISSQDATCDDLTETTTAEHATTIADFKEQDPSEKPREFLQQETEDKLTDAPEACEQSENETKENREEKPDESVKKSEEDEDKEEIRLGVQVEEKMEQNGLPHDITTDAGISTPKTPEVKVTVHDEKNEEEAEESKSPSIKEVCEETGEKAEFQEQAVNLLEKDKDIEMEQEVITLKKDQGKDEDINDKDVTFEGGFEEKIQQSEDNNHEVVKAKESIEEDTEEVRTVETSEKTEQQRLINVIPTDVCIATQIEPEEKVTENEERNDERANENDDGQMKKSEKAESEEGSKLPNSSTITPKENETASQDEDQQKEQELYMSEKGQTQSLAEEEVIEKETDSEKVVFESVEVSDSSSIEQKEKAVEILSKDETEEKEQELNMSEQGQEEDVVTCPQDATLKVGETVKENTKEMKTEKAEQQELLHAITTDDCIPSQAELQEEVIKNEEKAIVVEVKATQSDGDQKEKSDNLFVKEVCEETDLNKTEAEEGTQISDSSNMLVSSQDAAPEEDSQDKSFYNEGNKTEVVETRESVDEIESSVKTEEETEQQKLLHVITTDSCSSTQTEVPAETFEIKEKNEEAIENDDGQMNLESMEKEQELTMSEVQGGGEDLKTLEKGDEKKAEIGQHANTVEAGDYDETTKDIIKDEAKTIDVQEANINEDGENGEREQMPEEIVSKTLGSCSEIEQDQHTKEILPSVESNAEADVFISTQTESPEEATTYDEKATETDGDRKQKSDNALVKEVCDETNLEKSECEKQIEFPETSSLNPDEKSIPVVTKDEDQEKEQELKDETAVYEEKLQEKSYDDEGNKDKVVEAGESIKKDIEEQEQDQNEYNEPELVETRGYVDDDTQEIKSSVETKEYAETKPKEDIVENEELKDEDAIENDDDRTEKSESPLVKELCETTNSDRAESEEIVKLSDSFNTTLDENEMSKEENLERAQETKMSEIQGDEHDVISSQNESNEETEKSMIGEHATTVAYFEEGQGLSAKAEEIIKKEAEDELIDAGKASKQCENDTNDIAEQNPEESVNKSVNSCSEIVEGNVKEEVGTNKEIETELDVDSQPNRTVDGSEMKDEVVSTEKMTLEVGQSKEQYVEDIQTCLTESPSEKTEDEITKKNEHLSYDKIEDKDGNTDTEDKTFLDGRTREIEVSTLELAPVEEKNGDLDEVPKENFTDLKETTAVEPQEDSTPSNPLETSIEDGSNLEKVKAESENLPTSEESKQIEDYHNSETIMPEDDEEKGTITKDISSDEKQATEIMQETFEEVCEETTSEKAELKESLTLSDSSNLEINEKAVTFGDEDQKDPDVNISIEGQGKDNVTSSHDAVSEKENLQPRSYQNEGDEHEFLETGESVDEDAKETKSSVESKENKFETPLFKEVCEATTSENAESEDGVKHSEAYNTKPDENEIASKEENLEKEQELTISEVQGGGDNVTSSNEVIKETTISQPDNMVGNFEEGQDLSAVTKEITEEEAEDKSIDAQEANKECQDGAKGESEQNLEESVSEPVKSCVEIVEEHFTEDEADARYSNEIEAKVDAENQVDGTENRGEIKDEVFSAVKIPLELEQPKELYVEEIETCLDKTITEKTEYETTKKENDSSHDNIEDTNVNTTIEEKCTFEHEPVEEQNGGLDGVSKEILTDLNETAAVEPEDITPSGSLGTSTEDTSNSEKAKAESESLAIATHVEEEKRTATEEISSDQNLEPYRESKPAYLAAPTNDPINETTQESEKVYISTEENVTQLEQIAENNSPNGKRDTEEDVTQEDQLNSTQDCSEMVKDVVLTKEVTSEIQKENETPDFEEKVVDRESYAQNQTEMAHKISYPDPNPEMTEVKVNALIGQDLQVTEDISCESKVKNDSADQAPKEEQISSLEDAATVEPEVDLSKIESTAYPSSEKLPIQALEPVCNVQPSEVITELEDSEIKEEHIVLETVGHTDENKVEDEQIIRTDEISSAPDTEKKNERSSFLQNTEEKSLSKEELELLKVKPTSMIVEGQVNETKSQPEHLDITSENITNDQTLESEVEHTKEKKFEDVKMDLEEDVTLAPEIKGIEEKTETEKNVILTDQVVVEPTKENERIEVKGQVSEEDSSTTKLDTTSTSNQTELTDEIENSKPITVGNTEETEMKAESHLELGNIPAAEDLDCLSKASSTLEASNAERDDGTEKSIATIREVKDDSIDETSKVEVVPVAEGIMESELEANLPEIKSIDIPSDSQDRMKLTEGIPYSTQETIEVKDEDLISEVETHESLVKMGIQDEHSETTNDKYDTPSAEVSSEKNLEPYRGSKPAYLAPTNDPINETTQESEKVYISTEENMTQLEQIAENKSPNGERDTEENVMQEDQLNSTPDCSEMVKDVTQAPEFKDMEEKNETEKNVILTDQVVVEPTKENERNEVEGQVSEKDSSTTKLDTTSTSNQTELTDEQIEYSKPIPVGNTEETEMKAESHLELGNISPAEDLDCLLKSSSTLEASNSERDKGTEQSITTGREVKDDSVDETAKDEVVPVVEDITESELEANLPEIKSTDIPSDSQDRMKLTEGIPCSTQETIEVKDDELISEVETHESLVKMGIQEEHPETTNDNCDTPTAGVSSEKLLDEPEKLDAKDDTKEIAEEDKKVLEESYQDAVSGVTGHEQFSQTEELKELTEKLESMIPSEEPTPPTNEDQTNELTLETEKTKVEHGSLSNKDKNPELEEEEFAKPLSEDQTIKERYVEEEVQGKCGVEDTEEKSGNEVVEDVIVNEVLMEDETTKESLIIKDNNNEKDIQSQPMSVTQEVSQIERLSSSPDELLEKKDLVEDGEKPKLVAETLEIKDKTFTVMKESNEAIDIPAPEFENSEGMVTGEKITEADADKEKEPLEDPRADDPAEVISGSTSSSLEQDIEVCSEERGHGDVNKQEEKPTEAFVITSEMAEIVPNDREVSAISTDSLLETSPEMLLAKHDPKLTTTPEKIEDEIKDKEVACKSVEKTGELQVSTLNSEIIEGKQDGPDDIQNIEKEPVQPQEQEKLVDPPSDVEIKEQENLTHCGSQESSEENTLLSQNDKKIEDLPTLQSEEKEIMQGIDKGFEEAPVIEVQKNEKGLDQTTDITVDVVNDAECSEVEPPNLDTKNGTWEFVNEENQKDQENKVDEPKKAATPIEDVKSSTPELEGPSVMDEKAEKEGYNEDSEDKKPEAYEAEKGILTDNKYPESIFGISKPTEEVPGMKQEPLELNTPTTLGTETAEDLKISQKYVTNLSNEQAEPTEKSFTAEAEDLNASKASGTEAQCSSEVTQDEGKTSDEEKKSESAESTKGKTEVAENLNKEIEPPLTKDQQVDEEETADSAVKTDEENEEDSEKLGSCSEAPVMVEASKDMDPKVHKKSHNMLSGVGSKVKHSIAKVKKAITGKSFHPKPTSQ